MAAPAAHPPTHPPTHSPRVHWVVGVLVEGDEEDARVLLKDVLRAVAVVHVCTGTGGPSAALRLGCALLQTSVRGVVSHRLQAHAS